jgi:hypothetical protein
MLKKLSAESGLRLKALALIGALWLATLSGAWVYSAKAPSSAKAAPAVYGALAPALSIARTVC